MSAPILNAYDAANKIIRTAINDYRNRKQITQMGMIVRAQFILVDNVTLFQNKESDI